MQIKPKLLFTIIFFVSILLIEIYISGFKSAIITIVSIILYSLIFFGFYLIWKKIRKKEAQKYKKYLEYFLYRLSLLGVFLISLLGSLAYYYNKIKPASMPEYTISNGEKTIIFQSMSHIGKESFYEKIKDNIIISKNSGYVYFYEGVRAGSKKSYEEFNKAMGIKFDKDLYKNFSKLYGVTNQDNSIFLNQVNNLDFNIDLTMDQVMAEYNKKILKNTKSVTSNDLPIDASKEIIKTLSELNEKELKIMVYINQAILNFVISNNKIKNLISDNFGNQDLFEVILDKRNQNLAKEIINSKYDKIYITYGLLHFEGTLNLLKQNDSRWKIVGSRDYYPIR